MSAKYKAKAITKYLRKYGLLVGGYHEAIVYHSPLEIGKSSSKLCMSKQNGATRDLLP